MFVEPTPASISHQESLVLVGLKGVTSVPFEEFGHVIFVGYSHSILSLPPIVMEVRDGFPKDLFPKKRGSFSHFQSFLVSWTCLVFNGFLLLVSGSLLGWGVVIFINPWVPNSKLNRSKTIRQVFSSKILTKTILIRLSARFAAKNQQWKCCLQFLLNQNYLIYNNCL